MARDNGLRHTDSESPASTGRFAFLHSVSPVHMAAILAILAAALPSVYQIGRIGQTRAATDAGLLTKAPRVPQRAAPFARRPASVDPHAFTDPSRIGDSRLLSVAMLTFAGATVAPAGLGWKLKRAGSSSRVELELGGSTLPAPYADDPASLTSTVTTNTAGSRTVLDLSRPIRAGPGDAQAIATPAASFDRHVGEV